MGFVREERQADAAVYKSDGVAKHAFWRSICMKSSLYIVKIKMKGDFYGLV